MAEPVLTSETMPGPAETAEQREEVSIAFLTLLERLKPEQRVVYVLREAFDLSHEEIAEHLDKSAAACRQIFHRAQLRLSTERRPVAASRDDIHQLVDRFLAAFTSGNVARVAELLAPDVEWTTDAGSHRLAVRRVVTGVDNVARGIAGYARKWSAREAFEFEIVDLNGSPSIVWRYHGKLERVTVLDIVDGRIACVRNMMNPEKLSHLAASLGREVVTTGDLPFLVTRNTS
jgi:RNA polymerase sigma-70 factor (ECF subfamily)